MEDPFAKLPGLSGQRAKVLPPLQADDYVKILRALMLVGWIGLGLAVVLELWIRVSGTLIWPRMGGFSELYNALAIEYGLTNGLLTYLVVRREWHERNPRAQLARLRALLVFVLLRDALHVLALIHAAGSTHGPMVAAVPFFVLAGYLLLPRRGAQAYSIFFLAGYFTLLFLERAEVLETPGLLVPAFDVQGVGTGPGMIVLGVFIGASIIFGSFARSRLDEAGALLYRRSVIDALTGLYNHGYFLRRLEQEVDWARRQAEPISLILCEVDHFRDVNEKFGSQVGDQILEALGAEILVAIRTESDTPARYAGSTFAIVLPGAGSNGAKTVANRLARYVSEIPLTKDGGNRVTLSCGIATTASAKEVGAMELLEAADQCLYKAKKAGGDGVVDILLREFGSGATEARSQT